MKSKRGLLLPISAPSGTGKTTVCRELMKENNHFKFSVSCTTRSPRYSEKDGIDYYFITKEEFENYIKNNMFAEWEKIFGHYYGTLKSELENTLRDNKVCLLDVDVKGALNIKKLYPNDTITIFLLPPNQEELERRLKSRGTDNPESISKRKERLPEEVKLAEHFDYIIVNDKLDKTVDKIKKIIKDRMMK